MSYIQHSSVLPVDVKTVFAFFDNYARISELMPDDIQLKLNRGAPRLRVGSEYEFNLLRFGIPQLWLVKIENFEDQKRFSERQVIGNFAHWMNTYNFEEHGPHLTRMTNSIEYAMPFGLLGRLADDLLLRRDIARVLKTSHERLRLLLTQERSLEPQTSETGL